MSRQRVFILDLRRCFGCHGCTAACANVNMTSADVFWREVGKLPPHDGASDLTWLSLSCNHCANPPCVDACPSNALVKREEDGIVLHLEERCLGCRYCQMACPYDAIRWDAAKGIVSKCHFCHERLEEGAEPACVETCFAGALRQILIEDPSELDKLSLDVPGFTHHSKMNPSIRFVTGSEARLPKRAKKFPPPIHI